MPPTASIVAGFAIVPMRPVHVAAVLPIERASFPVPWDEATFLSELGHGWSHCFVLLREADQAVVGQLVFWSVAGEIELLNVAIHPAVRGGGCGRALVAHLIEWGLASGAERVTLEVRRGNAPAIALYQRMGFAQVAVRPRYYADNGEDALVMQRALSGPASTP